VTFGCEPVTAASAIPISNPSQVPAPKSGCSGLLELMELTYALDRLCTGRPSTRAFHTLSAGNIGQPANAALAIDAGRSSMLMAATHSTAPTQAAITRPGLNI